MPPSSSKGEPLPHITGYLCASLALLCLALCFTSPCLALSLCLAVHSTLLCLCLALFCNEFLCFALPSRQARPAPPPSPHPTKRDPCLLVQIHVTTLKENQRSEGRKIMYAACKSRIIEPKSIQCRWINKTRLANLSSFLVDSTALHQQEIYAQRRR